MFETHMASNSIPVPLGPRRVRVTTGSRLHFGMFSFGRADVRQFGGLGMMVEQPGVSLEVAFADYPVSSPIRRQPPHATLDRAYEFAERFLEKLGQREIAGQIEVRLLGVPSQHTGLGVGTQLALAVARGIECLLQCPPRSVDELATLLGRGRRSAVGVHGFERGGLIVEAGKHQSREISPLVAQCSLPGEWRIVLLTPEAPPGLAGAQEFAAFEQLPPVPESWTAKLCQVALLEVLPAAQTENVHAFGAAIDRFGRLAGECFAAQQGGIYASPLVADLAERARISGALGVAQSSWGPTLAAVLPDEREAAAFILRLQRQPNLPPLQTVISAPKNVGAAVSLLTP